MKYLLDANACIEHLRHGHRSRVTQRMQRAAVGDVCLCSVVRSELIFGAHRSQHPAAALLAVDAFWAGFASLVFDDAAATICGELRSHLAAQGTPIGPNDLLIAAIAKVHGLTLVSNNLAEFSRVPGLAVEDWSLP